MATILMAWMSKAGYKPALRFGAVSSTRSKWSAGGELDLPAQSGYFVAMQYPVVMLESAEGFAVSCPALPGCHSQGATRAEALANIREAIQLWLEVAEEDVRREAEADGAGFTRELVTI
jgi:predicted RNase H-like HicB family nuclease